MTWRRKSKAPAKPTRKAVQAALNSQRPLDAPEKPLVRKKPRRWVEDSTDLDPDESGEFPD